MRCNPSIALVLTPCISAAISTAAGSVPDGHEPLTTHDPDLYLFVDDHWIAEQHGLTRIQNQPRVLDAPIIEPDDPATERDCAWGNVIREPDGRLRLWYTTMMMGHAGGGAHEMARAGVWGRGEPRRSAGMLPR